MHEITYLDYEREKIKTGTAYEWQGDKWSWLRFLLGKVGLIAPKDKTTVRYYHNTLDTEKMGAIEEVRRQTHYLRKQGVKPRRIIVGYKQQEQILREAMDNHYVINLRYPFELYGVTVELHPLIDGIVVSGEE